MANKGQVILVTGGTGFAGSHLVEALIAHNYSNIHVTAFRDRASFLDKLIGPDHIHPLDLTDHQATSQLLAKLKPQQIYHLASLANVGQSFDKRQFLLETHLKLQLNLLDAIKQQTPQARMLSVGTALEYQASDQPLSENSPIGPSNPYALSKMIQDYLSYSYSQSEGLDIVRVRPFNHIGERQAPGFVISDFASRIVAIERGQSKQLKVGNLSAIRDFSDVKDIVEGYILLMEKGVSGEVYNLGSGVGYSIQQMLQMLIDQARVDIPLEIDDEKLRPVDLPLVVCNNKKIKNLGWTNHYQIADTLKRVLDWWRQQQQTAKKGK